jgi:hypothetical protein
MPPAWCKLEVHTLFVGETIMFSLSLRTNHRNHAAAVVSGNGYLFVGMSFNDLKPTNRESQRPERDSKSLSRPQ